jgi:hypothetical protein
MVRPANDRSWHRVDTGGTRLANYSNPAHVLGWTPEVIAIK